MRKPVHHRDLAGQPAPGTAREALASATAAAVVSFERDIRPMFAPFAAAMMWRFDLTDYLAVMANAQHIYERISTPGNPMPPPPFPMLTAAQIQRFQDWMNGGCKP
jgi:hypothetical protein